MNSEKDSLSSVAPWRLVNIGNSSSEKLLDFIEILEEKLEKKALKKFMPMQQGDVEKTWADCSLLVELTGFKPSTPIREGISSFVEWYLEHYKDK